MTRSKIKNVWRIDCMKYNKFGKTDIELSVLGFGGAKFRNTGKSNEENSERVLYAISKGVNHFDSNIGYTNSEEIFGLAIKQSKRDELYVSTKNQPAFYKTKQQQLDEIKRSLENMGLSHFDFYYMWNVKRYNEYEKAISAEDQYETLLEAKNQGMIRHICLSSHLDANESIKIIDDGKIEGILLNMNILNFPYSIDAAAHAKTKGIGVGIMSPLYGGQIPFNEEKLSFLNMHGFSPVGEALCFASGLWCVDYAYVGFRTNEEVDFACEIVDKNIIVDDNELSKIHRIVKSGLDKACCGCTYCMPYCPMHIPVVEYMLYYNLKYIYGYSQEDFENRLGFHKQWFMLAKRKADAKDCIKCGACEKECTQHIDIIARLGEIAKIEERLNI